MDKDTRWIQRFNNYNKALQNLIDSIEEYKEDDSDEIVQAAVIKFFEMTYELAWNTMKDFYEYQGETGIQGSKDTIKLANNRGLITEAGHWFDMVESRKLSVHTYDEDTASRVVHDIVATYIDLFIQLQTRLQVEKLNQQNIGPQTDMDF